MYPNLHPALAFVDIIPREHGESTQVNGTNVAAPTRSQNKDGGSGSLGTFGVCFIIHVLNSLVDLIASIMQVKSGLAQMLKVCLLVFV